MEDKVICKACGEQIKYNVYKIKYDVPLSFDNKKMTTVLCCHCMRKIDRFLNGCKYIHNKEI